MLYNLHQSLSRIDYKIFVYLNNWTGHKATDWFFILCAVYFAYLMPAVIIAWWFFAKDKIKAGKAVALSGISAAIARGVVKPVIVLFWARTRPFVTHNVHDIIGKNDNQPSFPSGHAIAMFAIAPVVYAYNKKLGIAMYVMASLTGISRVVVGVHYPSDIIGGVVLGILVGVLTVKFLDKPIEPLVRKVTGYLTK